MLQENNIFSKFAQHTVWDYIISRGIIALIIGILFITMPTTAINILCILIGILLLLNGLIALLKAMKSSNAKKTFLVYGLICLLLGIIFLTNQAFLAGLIVMIFALLILISGATQLAAGIKTKSTPGTARVLAIFTGLFSLILGIILLYHLNDAKEFIAIVIGIYFVAFGVLAIATGSVIRKASKNVKPM